MSTVFPVASEYFDLPIAQLQESPTNPRRRFDERGLAELADSFKAQGVLQPLLVRAVNNDTTADEDHNTQGDGKDETRYEVIAGARRLRAARLAALETVPVRVIPLSDAACAETQLVENIQREDVRPLEEAFAFHALLHTLGLHYDIHTLAVKAGKSAAFVATRLRLTELIPSIAEAFLADKIGVGHALEIAKLPQSEQQSAFDACFRAVWSGSKESRVLLPVRELAAWIEQNILLSLDSIPFDKNDETLVPEAGSCADCPKRTGYNTLLFGEATKDSCTDGGCYNNKLAQHIEKQIVKNPNLVQITTAWGGRGDSGVLGRSRYVMLSLSAKKGKSKEPASPYQEPCPHLSEAIVVEGNERGQTVRVYAEPNCLIHFADRNKSDPEELTIEREQRRKDLERQKLATTVRHRTLAEILKKIGSPLGRSDPALVAAISANKLEPLRREALARRHKMLEGASSEITQPQIQQAIAKLLRQSDEAGVSKLLVEIALLDSVDHASDADGDPLATTAKRHRVEMDKLTKAVEREFAAKRAKQKAKPKTAKKSTPPA